MYGIMLIVVLVLISGVIAFIGDRLGSKVGKKKLSLFGMRPKHTSILVTIVTGMLITTVTFSILAVASKDVRTALFGMEKLKAEVEEKRTLLEETSNSLIYLQKDLDATKQEYKNAETKLKSSQDELAKAKQSADLLRDEQQILQNRNQELWADNQNLLDSNSQLLLSNKFLKDNNSELEKLNDTLQEGIENIRETPIIYRVGELLASGVVKKTDDTQQIQNDLAQIMALANSKIVDRLGKENAKDGVWIYPIEYQETIEKLKNAQSDTVVRLIIAVNLVKGDPVLTNLELHPNRVVYKENELVYQKMYDVSLAGTSNEQLLSDFLRNVNITAVHNGILPNPLTGTVGVINANQIYAIQEALQSAQGQILISAYALKDTDVLGPLRLNISVRPEENK